MNLKDVKGTPYDYSDEKICVYFEVADKNNTKIALQNLDFIKDLKESDYGVEVQICIQQIPEVVRALSDKNIAIYAVIPTK